MDIESQMQAAMASHREGNLREAAEAYERIVEAEPSHARAWAALGQIWSSRLMYARAADCLARACEAEPEQFVYPYLMATALRRLGKLEESVSALTRAIELSAEHWESHLERIRTLERLGRDGEAARAREELLAALPADAPALERLGDELAERRRRPALACYERATEVGGSGAALWTKRGDLEREFGMHERALESYQRAIELDASASGAHAGLVDACERLGRHEDARWYAASALEHDPANIDLQLALGRMDRREGDLRRAIGRLRGLKADPRIDSKGTYGSVCIELGLALDGAGDAEGAIANIAEGQSVLGQRRAAKRYPRAGLLAWLRHVREQTAELEPGTWARPAASDREPIFVVGFVDSGVLAVAEMIRRGLGAGEASDEPVGGVGLADAIREMRDLVDAAAPYPAVLGALSEEQVEALRARAFADEGRVVDAQAMNIARLAAVKRLYPEAPVVTALRDPRDACLEAFFTQHEPDPTTVHFASLESTVALYEAVMDLYLVSRERLGLAVLEVRVEELGEARARVFEHVGIDVGGAGLGAGSDVGPSRWRRYARHLAPFGERLGRFVEAFGYERD